MLIVIDQDHIELNNWAKNNIRRNHKLQLLSFSLGFRRAHNQELIFFLWVLYFLNRAFASWSLSDNISLIREGIIKSTSPNFLRKAKSSKSFLSCLLSVSIFRGCRDEFRICYLIKVSKLMFNTIIVII